MPEEELHPPQEIFDDICSKIRRGSDLEIEKQIHDIIISNVSYKNNCKDVDHQLLGPLVKHEGVCDGISKLAVSLFRSMGIESTLVYGDLCAGGEIQGKHAWNLVRINGEWYHLDITSDLTLSDGGFTRYDYFNLTDDEILRDHKVDHQSDPCSKTVRNYYCSAGCFVKDIDEFRDIVRQGLRNGADPIIVKLPFGLKPEESRSRLVDAALHLAADHYRCGVRSTSWFNPDQMILFIKITKIC